MSFSPCGKSWPRQGRKSLRAEVKWFIEGFSVRSKSDNVASFCNVKVVLCERTIAASQANEVNHQVAKLSCVYGWGRTSQHINRKACSITLLFSVLRRLSAWLGFSRDTIASSLRFRLRPNLFSAFARMLRKVSCFYSQRCARSNLGSFRGQNKDRVGSEAWFLSFTSL